MRNQVAHIAALFGRRLTLWFAVAWNLMFALWIAAGGLEVKTAYVAHDAWMANLPMILTWAAVNFCVDRKGTRLNSSHVEISYAVFCLKKKNNMQTLD